MTPDRCPACRRPWAQTHGEREWRTLTTVRKLSLCGGTVEASYPNTTLLVCGDCAASLPKRSP